MLAAVAEESDLVVTTSSAGKQQEKSTFGSTLNKYGHMCHQSTNDKECENTAEKGAKIASALFHSTENKKHEEMLVSICKVVGEEMIRFFT